MDLPDRLRSDQRAVLQLVLGQGRGYAEIARLLSIDPTEVRVRAHAALDQLGPRTTVDGQARGRIADYLLGQLPADQAGEVAQTLARQPAQREWAHSVAAQLAPVAAEPLPPVPEAEPERSAPNAGDAPRDTGDAEPADAATAHVATADAATADVARSSRAGGVVLLSLAAAAIVAAIVIFVVRPGGHSGANAGAQASVGTNAAAVGSHAASTTGASKTKPSANAAAVAGKINLTPPAGGKPRGVAVVLDQGSLRGLAIEATNMPATSTKRHTAYAVWLYNSSADATRLGFVSDSGKSKSGTIGASAALPSNAADYKLLIVTLETGRHAQPGPVVLEGRLSQVPRSKL